MEFDWKKNWWVIAVVAVVVLALVWFLMKGM